MSGNTDTKTKTITNFEHVKFLKFFFEFLTLKLVGMKAHTVNVARFYKPRPKSVRTAAFSPKRNLLALSRDDGTIEVFNFLNANAPVLEKSIPGQGTELDRSIEALSFVKDGRLFSVGLHGFVKQHFVCEKDKTNSSTPEFWPVTSGAAWCMKYNEVRNKLGMNGFKVLHNTCILCTNT